MGLARGILAAAFAVIAVPAILLSGCSNAVPGTPVAEPRPAVPTTEEVASQIKTSMQDKFSNDPDLKPFKLIVTHVTAINSTGNEYKGIATVLTHAGAKHDVLLRITADHDNFMWETDPGAFNFAVDEGPAPGKADDPTYLKAVDGWTYVVTKSGKTRCQLTEDFVECEIQFSPVKYIDGQRVSGIRFVPSGSYKWEGGTLEGASFTKLDYGTYRTMSWTINATIDGTEFVHTNGNGIFVNTDGVHTS
ncbi:hypothetical protein HZU40_22345 [Mycolicibacterium fluoranthenivorans]|uniref:Lipoprotein n=1 Tax=Mycolicibacterium fluoranthenivorans TaxID=258505 RepID=A0A7G8P9E5_9MYCO|nr:hypothetical protein [Mycolicibacterium fluoranthenivorans]QNJ90961.1 hypothetical protein HZU40_22345 [Mycolicibacterium fluoranthenivorans]